MSDLLGQQSFLFDFDDVPVAPSPAVALLVKCSHFAVSSVSVSVPQAPQASIASDEDAPNEAVTLLPATNLLSTLPTTLIPSAALLTIPLDAPAPFIKVIFDEDTPAVVVIDADPSTDTTDTTDATDITKTNPETAAAADSSPIVQVVLASKPDILLVDIAGLGYAAMYTPMGKLAHQGFPTGAIHGAIASLFARMAQRPGAVPVVLWDNKAHWRHEMLPEYKATRGADPTKQEIREQYRLQIPYIQLLLSLMGIPQVSCGDSEADDLAGAVCRGLDPSWIIEMVSRDTDWWQQLDERCTWYSPVHRKSLTLKGLADPANGMKDGHFLSTNEYLEAKALAGDSSDEIPGILSVGLLTACKIIRQHGTSIRDFWSKVDSGQVAPKGIVMTRVANAESRAIFERNVKLMDWREAPPLKLWALAVTAGRPDFAQLEAEAACLGLKKLVANAKEALKPWKSGWGPVVNAVSSALHHSECQPVIKPRIDQADAASFG